MSKWYGTIGFANTAENAPGVYKGTTMRQYYGDLTRPASRWQGADKVNDDISITNELSIVADPFAYEQFSNIRYAEIFGSKWKVNKIEIQYPRLILSIGGLYNG